MLTEGTLVAGRYLVTAQLGRGGMGAVHLVRDKKLGRQAALKVFAARPEETSLARFRREARIMARLRHPNLAAVYETVEVDGLPALVQEYVEGRDLQDLVDGGTKLDEASVRRLLEEMASALALLHASGVIHRDVKPGNVMLEPSGRFRLMDLGLARADDMTAVTETGSVVGTPMFVAPNVLLSVPAGAPDDVYALGLLINLMATGTHLHGPVEKGRSFLVEVAQGRFIARTASPGLAPDLARVVNACCKLDPEARPADGQAVLTLMASPRRRSRGEPHDTVGTAPVEGAAEREGLAPAPSRRRLLAGALGLGLLLVLGAGLLPLRPRPPRPSPALPPPALALTGDPEARLGLATLDLRWTASGGDGLLDLTVEAAGEKVERRSLAAGRSVLRLPGGGTEPAEVRWRLHDGSRTLAEGSGRTGYVQRGTLAGAAGLPAVGGPEVAPVAVAGGVVLAATPGVLLCLEPRHGPSGPSLAARWRAELPQMAYATVLPGQEGPSGRRYAHAVAAMTACEPDGLVLADRTRYGSFELRSAAAGTLVSRVALGGGVGSVAGASLGGGVQVWAVETAPPPSGAPGVGTVELVRTRAAGSSLTLERGEPVGPGEPVLAAALAGRWFLCLLAGDETVELLAVDALASPGPTLVARWPMGARAGLGGEEARRATLCAWRDGAVAVLGGAARLPRAPAGVAPFDEPPLVPLGVGADVVPGFVLPTAGGRALIPLAVPVMEGVAEPVRVMVVEVDPGRGVVGPPGRLGGIVSWPLRFCAGLSLVRAGGSFFTHVGGVVLADGAGAPDGLTALYGLGEVETRQPLVVLDGTVFGFGRQGQVLGLDLVDAVE